MVSIIGDQTDRLFNTSNTSNTLNTCGSQSGEQEITQTVNSVNLISSYIIVDSSLNSTLESRVSSITTRSCLTTCESRPVFQSFLRFRDVENHFQGSRLI